MQENRTSGSVWGVPGNQHSYRERDRYIKMVVRLFILSLLLVLVSCAYVNDSRLYSIRPSLSNDQAQQIARVVEAEIVKKGLVLKTKYHDTYPEDIAVSVFEIPRLPDGKRRDPQFIFYIRSGNLIELKHSEWWLNTSERPRDYIKNIAPELISTVKKELGLEIELAILKEDLY